MAEDVTIGGGGALFIGEDKTIELEILDENDAPVDAAGWSVLLDVRILDTSADPALLSKAATITGTFNASRALNTQRATVSLTDADLANAVFGTTPRRHFRYSMKRLDGGVETVLAYGVWRIERTTQI